MAKLLAKAQANWFYPVVGLALAFCAMVSRFNPRSLPVEWEAAVLLDVLIAIPVLFALCCWRTLSPKALTLRVLALQCSGLFLASWIVPESQQVLLTYLYPLRWAGIVMLVAVEGVVLAATVRLLFKPGTGTEHLMQQGVPEIVAKFMLLEARFWRWVFSRFHRR